MGLCYPSPPLTLALPERSAVGGDISVMLAQAVGKHMPAFTIGHKIERLTGGGVHHGFNGKAVFFMDGVEDLLLKVAESVCADMITN